MGRSRVADEILAKVKDKLTSRLADAGIALGYYSSTHERDWLAIRIADGGMLPVRTIVSDRDRESGWWGLTKGVIDKLYEGKPWIVLLILDEETGTLMTGEQFVAAARFYSDSQKYSLWGEMADAGTRYSSLDRLAEMIEERVQSL